MDVAFLNGMKIKRNDVTQQVESYVKFKFQCQLIKIIETHSHSLVSISLHLLSWYNDKTE